MTTPERTAEFRNAVHRLYQLCSETGSGVSVMHTLGPYRGEDLLGILQRGHDGNFVIWIAKGLPPDQESAVFGMAEAAIRGDGTLPGYDQWQEGGRVDQWVYPVSPATIEQWRLRLDETGDQKRLSGPSES